MIPRTLFVTLATVLVATKSQVSVWPDAEKLRPTCEEFLQTLDAPRVAKDYPKAIQNLLSLNSDKQIRGIRTLLGTGELEILPWIVPFLDSKDQGVQTEAGFAIQKLVSDYTLKRRDHAVLDRVAIKPLGPTDPDLRPLAWIVAKMLTADLHGSLGAYAMTIIGYLKLKEFEEGLRDLARTDSPRAGDAKDAVRAINE
jgi:hypothetical protein